MALTYGSGPFGPRPAGRFDFEPPEGGVSYLELSPRRVRGRLGGETVVDSTGVRMLHESGRLPTWWLPRDDVRSDVADRLGEERADDDRFQGLVHIPFRALDEWLEEDEPQPGHPRDPYHRLDVRPTSRRVRVSLNGQVLAESERTMVMFEAGHPPRWYFPAEDVRTDLLRRSETRTVCAYKGVPEHWSSGEHEDVAWTYREPFQDAQRVRDLIAFYDERVDVEVDGEAREHPRTQWSRS